MFPYKPQDKQRLLEVKNITCTTLALERVCDVLNNQIFIYKI